jgi:hypothetical protein
VDAICLRLMDRRAKQDALRLEWVLTCSGHIDRSQFVRRSPPDWCRHFDVLSG